jgi:tetratricopeptide (TPR) repeat protein
VTPTLALSMIVKNGERDLAECLSSVRGVAHEIVIADTGSTDGSVKIAQEFGAKVFAVGWDNDFAKARNLSLAKVTADWVLMLDADERLDSDAANLLPALLGNHSTAGYQVIIRNYVMSLQTKIWDRVALPNDRAYAPAHDAVAYVDHENVRLFRRDPEIFFTGRVHETVGWQILAAKRTIGASKLKIHHMGMLRSAEERAQKLLFYRDLGRQKVQDMPENSQAHFELGVSELENFGNVEDALRSIERSCELNPKFGVAWFFAGVCHSRLGDFAKATKCLQRAVNCGHATAAVAELMGDAQYNLGDFDSAAAGYRRALRRAPGHAVLESKLGLAEVRLGNPHGGLKKMARAIANQPSNPELHDRLVAVNVWLNRLPAAAEAAEQKLKAVQSRPEDFLRAASIWAKLQDWTRAAGVLRDGICAFPHSEALQSNLNQIETHHLAVTQLEPQSVPQT